MDLRYLRTLAHDLKGPIGNTLMFTDMLRSKLEQLKQEYTGPSDEFESVLRLAHNIYSMNMNMTYLIDSWVESYKILSGDLKPHIEKTTASDIVEKVLDDLSIYFDKKNIEVKTDIDQQLEFFTDVELIQRALANLLIISITFGEMNMPVKVSVRRDSVNKSRVRFSIVDNYQGSRSEIKNRYLKKWELSDLDTHSFDDGIIKPTAFGLVFIAAMVDNFEGERGITQLEDGAVDTWFALPV